MTCQLKQAPAGAAWYSNDYLTTNLIPFTYRVLARSSRLSFIWSPSSIGWHHCGTGSGHMFIGLWASSITTTFKPTYVASVFYLEIFQDSAEVSRYALIQSNKVHANIITAGSFILVWELCDIISTPLIISVFFFWLSSWLQEIVATSKPDYTTSETNN